MDKTVEQIIVDVIRRYMDLPENYGRTQNGDVIPCVIVASQNIKLFNTDKIQITVKTISCENYASHTEFKEVDNGYQETVYLNEKRIMQVDVYSRNNDARDRFWEVTSALKSYIAQEQEDLYNFKIAKIAKARNLSGLDGGSDINRFTVTFNLLCHDQKTKFIDYYDKFPLQVYTEREKIYDKVLQST